jgi:serine/threonine-protein kinase
MGAVYEGLHVDLRKRVAIKTLHPELAHRSIARQRFLREGEAASRIRHPHVVDVTDVDIQDGMPYLVMEYLEGLDLKQHIVSRGPMSPIEAVDTLVPVVAAVATGHDEGVIHRDLKPHNIFLARTRTGEVLPKVLDFGVSKLLDPQAGGISLTGTAAVMGTVAYMSPEQARGAKFVDGRTDQYAIALILYECLTGKRPHRGENTLAVLRNIGDGRVDPPGVYVSGVPTELEKVILKGLQLKPDDRYPNLYQFGRALLPFASDRIRAVWQATLEREPSQASVVYESDVAEAGPPADVAAAAGAAAPEAPLVAPADPDAPEPPAVPIAPIESGPVASGRSTPKPQRTPLTPTQGTVAIGRPSAAMVDAARARSSPLERVSSSRSAVAEAGGDSTLGQSAAEISVPAAAPAPGSAPGGAGGKKKGSAIVYGAGGALLAAAAIVIAVRVGGQSDVAPTASVAGAPSGAPPPAAVATPPPVAPAAAPAPAPASVGTYRVELTVEPASATLSVDDAPAGTGRLVRDFPKDGRLHTLIVKAPGYLDRQVEFSELAPPDRRVVLARAGKPDPASQASSLPAWQRRAKALAGQPEAPASAKPRGEDRPAEARADKPASALKALPESKAKPPTPKVGANGALILKD